MWPLTKNDTEKLLSEATYGIDRKVYSNIEGKKKKLREGFQEEA